LGRLCRLVGLGHRVLPIGWARERIISRADSRGR
jgi:hypothetical protein